MAGVKECRFKIYKNYITGCTYFRRRKHCSIYFQLCVCVNLPFFQVSLSMVSTSYDIFGANRIFSSPARLCFIRLALVANQHSHRNI